MAHVIRETRVVGDRGGLVDDGYGASMVARVVYTISGVINTLLAIRFVLVLLGANAANPFASFIYSVTRPLVAPFFGLFNYNFQVGVVRFEFETLIAMAVYSAIAWLIARLFSGVRDYPDEY